MTKIHDLVVVGATPAGCAAAIEAARGGVSVILLESTFHAGGMLSNGLSILDLASPDSVSGILKEFVCRVLDYYRAHDDQAALFAIKQSGSITFEPKVARRIWSEILASSPNLQVRYGMVASACKVLNGKIMEVQCMPALDALGNCSALDESQLKTFAGRLFIDATYEGDLLAFAGCEYAIGREPRTRLEPHAGVIFTHYMERRPVLGWLPQTILPGSTGLADDCVMGVNLRPVVKRYPQGSKSRIKVAMPEGYSTDVYSWFTPGTEPLKLPSSQLPNGKFDLNLPLYGHDTLSRDLVLAAPHERKWLREECVRFAQGYLYYLQTELGLEDIALAHDEFTANCNLPEQIYIREGRRLQGQVVLNEANINPWLTGDGERPPLQADSVAIGDFELDGKTCRRVVTETGVEQPEGWFFLRGVRAPFQVPFAAMVPKEGSPENLLVPVCLSCTHVAFTAVRMEPVWVQTGQAAGRAAALSLQLNCAPGHLQVSLLQRSLISEGCTLIWFRDIMPETVGFKEIQLAALSGFIPSGSNLKFNPGALLCRSELAHWLVRCLNIPISVSASHYSDVSLSHPHFRAVETLYDLATRNGVLIFGCERVDERPHFFYLHRPDQVPECLSEFEPDATVTCAEFALIVDKLKLCLRAEGLQCPSAIARSEGTSALSRLVFSYWLAQ